MKFSEKFCEFLRKYGRITIFGQTYGIKAFEKWCIKKGK